jgi:DNA-binding NarL/FixJ family response regulator
VQPDAAGGRPARPVPRAVGTVRKHREHIFDRTGVRTRSAAVAGMMPRLSAPPPP